MTSPENRPHQEAEPGPQETERTPEAERKESVLAELGYEARDLTPERLAEVREAAGRSRRESERTLEDRFEKPAKPDQKLRFHNRRHSQGVAERAGEIAPLLVSEDDPAAKEDPEQFARAVERLQLSAETLALDHDRVNTSIIIEVPDANFDGTVNKRADGTPFTKKIRKRALTPDDLKARDVLRSKKLQAEELGGESLTASESDLLEKFETLGPLGTNEAGSATETRSKLRNEQAADGSYLFTAAETGGNETYRATVPGWDGANKTVAQVHLSERTSATDRAIALADLGEAGRDPEGYMLAGDALLLEDFPDIEETLREPGRVDEEKKRRIVDRILAFSGSQVAFARGRKARLHGYEVPVDPKDETKGKTTVSDLDGLTEDVKDRIKKYFNRFDGPDGSIARAGQVAKKRSALFAPESGLSFDQAFEKLRKELLNNEREYAMPLSEEEESGPESSSPRPEIDLPMAA